MFVGVPRVWEKFKEIMEKVIKDTSGIKEVVLQKARVSRWCGRGGECEGWSAPRRESAYKNKIKFLIFFLHSLLVVKPVSTGSLVGQWPGVSGSLTREFN